MVIIRTIVSNTIARRFVLARARFHSCHGRAEQLIWRCVVRMWIGTSRVANVLFYVHELSLVEFMAATLPLATPSVFVFIFGSLPDQYCASCTVHRFDSICPHTPPYSRSWPLLDGSDFWMAGIFRFATEMCKIFSPMIVREVILFVKSESTIAPQSAMGGLGLALLLLFVVLVQACTLQHFIHGGKYEETSLSCYPHSSKDYRFGNVPAQHLNDIVSVCEFHGCQMLSALVRS